MQAVLFDLDGTPPSTRRAGYSSGLGAWWRPLRRTRTNSEPARWNVFIAAESLAPVDFDGLRVFDYTASRNLSSSLAVVEVPPGTRHAEAWSTRSDKYYLVVAGEVRFVLDGVEQNLAEGDFCLVPQGRRFSYSNPTTHTAKLVLVHTPSFDLEAEVFA